VTRLPRRSTLVVLVCVVLLAGVAVASLVLALGGSSGSSPIRRPSAHATLSSPTVLFGDTVQATLNLVVPHSMSAIVFKGRPNFGPFQVVSSHVAREDLGGGLERISLSYGIACLSSHCLSSAAGRPVQFKPTSVPIPGGRLRAVWPPLLEVSRAENVNAPVTSGLAYGPTVPPGLQPRRDRFEALGAAGLALALLLATWLVLRQRVERRRAAAARQGSLLQALLARVEDGLPEDVLYRQRHALDALAVELRHRHINGGLAVHAERLAWAPEQPDPEDIRALCAEVRRLVKA
jgi:hypothetical protein